MRAFQILAMCAIALPVDAQRSDPASEVAAALSLAEAGLRAEDPALITAAIELLTQYRLLGPEIVMAQAAYRAEARFFSRGDSAIAQRLGAAQASGASDTEELWVFPFQTSVSLPPAQNIRTVSVTSNAVLHSVGDSDDQTCGQSRTAWHCGFAAKDGVLNLAGSASGAAWLVIELDPADE